MATISWVLEGVIEGTPFATGFAYNDSGNEGVNIDDFTFNAWEVLNEHVDEFNLDVPEWSAFLLRAYISRDTKMSVNGMELHLWREL